MTFTFRPAATIDERFGVFVSLVGGTNSGKTFSALRLARGIAGPTGKVAVLDTEGGRTLHLKDHFQFDAHLMEAPFRPDRFAQAAKAAEDAGYDVLLIDSFSAEWAGEGGVLSWHDEQLMTLVNRQREKAAQKGWGFDENRALNANKMAAWIEPKSAHKAMVYSLLQRRIPIIFSIRGEASIDADTKKEAFKAICDKRFPFEVTVSFRLAADRKGIIDLSDPNSWKMEGAHRDIFRNGEQLSERHGEALRDWASGGAAASASTVTTQQPPQQPAQSRTIAVWTPGGEITCTTATEWLSTLEGWLKSGADEVPEIWQRNAPLLEKIRAKAVEREDGRMCALADAVASLNPAERQPL